MITEHCRTQPHDNTGRKRSRTGIAFLIVLIYFTVHFSASRISLPMVEQEWGFPGFFYLPVKPSVMAEQGNPLIFIHWGLAYFFYRHGSWTMPWVVRSQFGACP